jgi:cobalt-precorrin 5A hydrolase
MQVILGLGCDRNTSLNTLQIAIKQALESINIDIDENTIAGAATIDKKNDEQAILQLTEQQKWPLHFFTAKQLAKVPVPSPSKVVLKYMGTPSVSEAAAILAAGVTMQELLLEKYKYLGDDGKNATVSIAVMK